jgi:Ca2+-binding EF-hand superfamily protein
MKLAALVLASLLALPTAARADEVLNPPGGPVLVEADYQQSGAPAPEQRQKNRELKRALMLQFDRDGDGRLDSRERMQAVRVLERIQRKLAGHDGQARQGRQGQQGQQKRRRFIQRFDTNGDGNVDRSEMPPGAARKLRRLDRDHDGWVEPNEVR